MKKIYFVVLFLLATSSIWAQTQILAPLPIHSSNFTGNVRGYWFTSPTCYTITGLEVATEAGAGAQSIAVIRLPAPPPIFSATTNVFTTLFLTQNNPATGIIPCNIQVEQGDHIMILGQRATVNSYSASGTFTTSINGLTTTISRCGMQFPLTTTAPQQVWQLTSGSISRVHMYYDSVITYNLTATPTGPSSFTFSDGSDSSFTSVWNYGDGSPLDNVWQGSHNYAAAGSYTVCSYVTNNCGIDTVCTTVTVCGAGPTAGFAYFSNGLNPSFVNTSSSGTASYAWDFGDGGTSTAQNPSHTYAAAGPYTVCLISTDSCAQSDTLCLGIVVCDMATSGFSASGSGFVQSFTNASTNAASYWWDFGDGSFDTTASPMHTFPSVGWYTVCLIATNSCAEADTICDSVLVCVPPIAGMTYTMTGLNTVNFSNGSTNGSTYWWDFGDGSTDTSANPMHVYTADGIYTVCLITSNLCGADTTCDSIAICLTPLAADFSVSSNQFMVTCSDLSTGAATYSWSFGDGGTSTQASPTHTYAQNGSYVICLTITNNCGGTETMCDTVLIDVIGVSNVLPGFEITVAPNPMSQRATVMVTTTGTAGVYTLELLDIRGALVLTREGQVNVPLTFDKASLASGMYSFRILQAGNALGTGKLIVE